jgi:sugar phosphate isomerase/epimerase
MGLTLVVCALEASSLPGAEPTAGKGFNNPFFAFCMDTHDSKKRSLDEQAKLLAELGYAGAGHLWLDGLAERLETLDDAGLKLFQVYLRVSLDPSKPPFDPRLEEVMPLLKGRGTMLAVLIAGMSPSDPAGDARAVPILRQMAELAQESGVKVALYPHANDWLERAEDGVRIAKKVDRPNVGVMFNLCHWLKVDGKSLEATLASAAPHLVAVSINGADQAAEIQAGRGKMILPLGEGAFDMAALLKTLRDQGYTGPVGLQCYGLPGDAREHLARSMAAWRKLVDRLNAE